MKKEVCDRCVNQSSRMRSDMRHVSPAIFKIYYCFFLSLCFWNNKKTKC